MVTNSFLRFSGLSAIRRKKAEVSYFGFFERSPESLDFLIKTAKQKIKPKTLQIKEFEYRKKWEAKALWVFRTIKILKE